MAKDPAFLFYPGDYLRDTQVLSEPVQVAYDRIMCEHMRNICISQQQLNFLTKKLSPDEKTELLAVLTKISGGFQISWVAESISKRKAYGESRRKNRVGKTKEHINNTSSSYEQHMEIEIEIENEDESKDENRKEDLKEETLLKVSDAAKKLEIKLPWNTETFEQAWEAWLRFRWTQHKFKFKSEESLMAALKRLTEISEGQEVIAIAIIQESMANGWAGLFALKTQSTQKNGKSRQFNVNKIKSLLERDFGG